MYATCSIHHNCFCRMFAAIVAASHVKRDAMLNACAALVIPHVLQR